MLVSDDDAGIGDWQLPGLTADAISLPREAATFDLTLSYRQHYHRDRAPAGLRATLGYSSDMFDHRTVQALAARLTRLLRQAASHPDDPLTALKIITSREREQILVRWNDASRDVPQATAPDLFQRQAARTPGATRSVNRYFSPIRRARTLTQRRSTPSFRRSTATALSASISTAEAAW